jgi:hypothetical protein
MRNISIERYWVEYQFICLGLLLIEHYVQSMNSFKLIRCHIRSMLKDLNPFLNFKVQATYKYLRPMFKAGA